MYLFVCVRSTESNQGSASGKFMTFSSLINEQSRSLKSIVLLVPSVIEAKADSRMEVNRAVGVHLLDLEVLRDAVERC